MRAYGNKRITPVYGDYRPRERRWNNIKIHGWHDEDRTGDTAVEWDDTYNDYVGGYVHGQSELQAEYYASEGDSEQTGTPTPDAPIPITPHLTAGTYKITMPDGTYEATLPNDMHGINGVRDRVVVDYVSKRVWLDVRAAKYTITGNEVWLTTDTANQVDTIRCSAALVPSTENLDNSLTTHFQRDTVNTNDTESFYPASYFIALRIKRSRLSTNDLVGFKSWLAANTPEVVYQLTTPTKTPLTLTPVDSSTAPELPREFLADAGAVSPDLPATIESAQPVVTSGGRNLFDMSLSPLFDSNKKCLVATIYAQSTRKELKYFCNGLKVGDIATLSGISSGQQFIYLGAPATILWYFNAQKTITQEMLDATIYIYTLNWTDSPPVDIWLQIELGTTAHPYTPYRPPSTVTLPELRAIALPETATEWTYIRDGVKYWADTARYVGGGWWDVVRRCDTLRLDANSNWIFLKTNGKGISTFYYSCNIPSPGSDTIVYKNMLCTHFRQESVKADSATRDGFAAYSNDPNRIIQFYLRCSTIHTVDDLKYFLVNNNVFLLYELAEPTTERVHLGTLKSYPRYTHVEQITDGVRADMQLTAKVVDG